MTGEISLDELNSLLLDRSTIKEERTRHSVIYDLLMISQPTSRESQRDRHGHSVNLVMSARPRFPHPPGGGAVSLPGARSSSSTRTTGSVVWVAARVVTGPT